MTDKQITNNRVKGLQRPDMIKKNAGNGNSSSAASDLPNIKHKGGSKYVLSTEVRNILRSLFHKEQAILQKVFHSRPYQHDPISGDLFSNKQC